MTENLVWKISLNSNWMRFNDHEKETHCWEDEGMSKVHNRVASNTTTHTRMHCCTNNEST